MKLLHTLTAASLSLIAYTSVAAAAETAEAATDSVDPSSVSGVLPAEKTDSSNGTADKEASAPKSKKDEGREAKNAIYLDLLGPGLIYSINYDREIIPDLSARIGFSYLGYSVSASDGAGTSAGAKFSYFAIPLTVSYLGLGSKSNCLELGGGAEILNMKGNGFVNADEGSASVGASRTFVALTALAGYRHQPEDGGFVFRIGLSPTAILGLVTVPTGYLSLGAAF